MRIKKQNKNFFLNLQWSKISWNCTHFGQLVNKQTKWSWLNYNILSYHFSSMNFFYMEVFGIFWCKLLFTNVTGIIFWFIFMFSFKVSLQIPFKDSFFAIFTLDNFFGFFWFATFFGVFMTFPLVSSEVCSFSKLGRANVARPFFVFLILTMNY